MKILIVWFLIFGLVISSTLGFYFKQPIAYAVGVLFFMVLVIFLRKNKKALAELIVLVDL